MLLETELTADFGQGMLDNVSPINFPTNACGNITNGRIFPDASVRRRFGTIRTNSSQINSPGQAYGCIEFIRASDLQVQLCLFIDTKFYVSTDNGATWTDKTGGNSLSGAAYSLATMRVGSTTYLFGANGATSIWRWNGTTLDACPNAPSGVKYIAVFNGRLYATGHSGVIVQGSAIGDPTTWSSPSGLTIQIITHSGDTPTGMYQIGPHLLVFDVDATSYVDGYGEQTLIVAAGATGFSRSVGCIAFRSIVGTGENSCCWLSKRGIEYYSAATGIQLISRGLNKFFRTSLNRNAIAGDATIPTATYDPLTMDYYLAIPTVTTQNDTVVVINLLQRGEDYIGGIEIDSYNVVVAGSNYFFQDDGNGYLGSGGSNGLYTDTMGYAALMPGGTVIPTIQDSQNYLASAVTGAMCATLFTQSDSNRGTVVCSAGYDGWMRKHDAVNLDDENSDGSGGLLFSLSITSRPFLFKNPRQRKYTRALHCSSINAADAKVYLYVVDNSGTTIAVGSNPITIKANQLNQPRRILARVFNRGDDPQAQIVSSDDVRIVLLGLSAGNLREPIK